MDKPKPHWGMYYLMGYLSLTGLAFLSAPAQALRLLGATGSTASPPTPCSTPGRP